MTAFYLPITIHAASCVFLLLWSGLLPSDVVFISVVFLAISLPTSHHTVVRHILTYSALSAVPGTNILHLVVVSNPCPSVQELFRLAPLRCCFQNRTIVFQHPCAPPIPYHQTLEKEAFPWCWHTLCS